MKKNMRGRFWLWLLLLVILAGIGYYFYSKGDREPKQALVTKEVAPVQQEPIIQESVIISEEKEGKTVRLPIQTEEEIATKRSPKEDYCVQIEKNVADFFRYLDQKQYVQELDLQADTYTHFKKIIKRMAARPPVPAGEGEDPKIIIQNVFHFFRVLKQKDLRLINQIIKKEKDTLEVSLEMFYRWFTLGDRCPDLEQARPSMQALYQYAGFLLNTTGGRAYLFRRSVEVRLLTSYYCLLIVHDADKTGSNNYGIDIYPYIEKLEKEISHYPDFQFQSDYIEQLKELEDYYMQKR